ncbi:MAG: hypothetical protein WBM08_04045 [Prochlorococcaceae cyanobacterium]
MDLLWFALQGRTLSDSAMGLLHLLAKLQPLPVPLTLQSQGLAGLVVGADRIRP